MAKKEKTEQIEVLEEYEIVEEPVIIKSRELKPKKPKKEPENISLPKIYVGFTPRVVGGLLLVILFSIITITILYKSFTVGDLVNIRYNEKSTSELKVMKNQDEEYQKEDKNYDTSAVHSIIATINYSMMIKEEANLQYTTEVVGDLYIKDKNNPDKVFFQESYTLMPEKKEVITNKKEYQTSTSFQIDYQDYNNIAKKYLESYGEEAESYLEVKYLIKYKNTSKSPYKMVGESAPTLMIPLTVSNMKVEEKNINTEKRVNERPKIILNHPLLFVLGCIFGLISIFILGKTSSVLYATVDNKSIYDKTVEKILKKHKKAILEVLKAPSKKGKKTIRIKTFEELWEVHKQTKIRIQYLIIKEHTKCEFYLSTEDKNYVYTLKEIDLEKK